MKVTVRIEDRELDIVISDESEYIEVDPILADRWSNGSPAELFQQTIQRAWAAYRGEITQETKTS